LFIILLRGSRFDGIFDPSIVAKFDPRRLVMAVKEHVAHRVVGQGIPRLDADEKVRGLAAYADDVQVPDAWHCHVVRSPVSCGRLRSLTLSPDFDWSRVVVVTPEDIPGTNIVDMMGRDMPFIAYDEIQYLGEPLALVAAPTRHLAKVAGQHIHADIEEWPALCTLDEMIARYKKDPSTLHKMAAQTIRKGDAATALAEADIVLEREYTAGHQEQLYIEPQGMIVVPEPDGTLLILGSMQCPYYINPELCETLAMPPEKLRVRQSAVGGAFGGKEEFPTLIAGYCALLALKAGRPVKLVYDRNQDILYTTKRHPSWSRYRVGLKKDGTIHAVECDFVLDGGAYTTLSPVVMYRGILHAAMGYRCENVAIDGHVFRTNTFPNGAFRGFGAPQALWGWESLIDEMAAACDLPPHEFRLRNCLQVGDTTPTGGLLRDEMGSPAVLEKSLARCDFDRKWRACSHGRAGEPVWYGIGLSFFAHGSGFTGDGEARIKSKVAVELDHDDSGKPIVNVRVSSTEMGQGTCTILPQVVADALSISIDHTAFPMPDTFLVPDSGPTVASRTAMVVGSTLHTAGCRMKGVLETFVSRQMLDGQPVELVESVFHGTYDGRTVPFAEGAAAYLQAHGKLRVIEEFKLPDFVQWDQKTFRGDAYPGYAWGCNVVEVEVDPLTCEFRIGKITAFYDIGRLLNPVLAMGQIQGGLIQALGYAMMEKITVKNGKYDADRMQTYVIPTAVDGPEMDLHFVEYPWPHSEPGAKGVGEIPMDGLAPALANALEQAVGVRLRDLPLTPEKLFEAMAAANRLSA
jgi:CO/xanthine dehydrogenase Mo-binding subunit